MAFVRRAALTGALLVLAAAGLSQDATRAVRLRATARPSGLVIENATDRPMLIERAIRVDKLIGATWTPLTTEMKAIDACTANAATGPVRLGARVSLSVVPWRGASCSGQCTYACRANIDFPPGRFRFVVTTLPERTQLIGPAFRLDHSL
ncbi:hypothetical protein [Sphingomonas sp.]|uniref:hypothetical protein n=1 Tax=Sphingomonas sp. TaxID=28214 RepID=UPI003CC62850